MRERLENLKKLKNHSSSNHPLPKRFPGNTNVDAQTLQTRWEVLNRVNSQKILQVSETELAPYVKNIENCIGRVSLPVGIAGPLRINGAHASGDYFIPMATTEATLVASYHRGSRIISAAGGCNVAVLHAGISRAPGFVFQNLSEAIQFVQWVKTKQEIIKQKAESTTRFGKLIDLSAAFEGNYAYLIFDYDTGDAAGQNMVTIATQTACSYILEECPIKPRLAFVESNLSGDKKAASGTFSHVRGKKVIAEVTIPNELIQRTLRTDAQTMTEYNRLATSGAIFSGAFGVTGHYSNALAAIFIACGQDAACVAEASLGITRLHVTAKGDLYMAISIPNLPVGTIGGGTSLPTQKACLDILQLHGTGKTDAFAEVCAGLCLAGDLSLIGALCANEFSKAHQNYARIGPKSSK